MQMMVVLLHTRWCAVGISRNPFKIGGDFPFFPTCSDISLGYMLDGGEEPVHT
jgi:hypothetical protein